MATKINPPSLTNGKSYELYKQELLAWREVTELVKEKQGVVIALSLPENHEQHIREKVFDQVKLEDLKKDDGLDILLVFLDKHLAKDDLSDSLEKFEEFEDYHRIEGQSISDYIAQFDSKYKKVEKKKMVLPPEILAFKLLRKANITKEEKMLVLTGMNYEDRANLYEQAKKSLKKFKGEVVEGSVGSLTSTSGIKLEPTFLAENEEALLAAGYVRAKPRYQPKFGGKRGGKQGQGYNRSSFSRGKANDTSVVNKKINPVGSDGRPLVCRSCGSFRHLVSQCPDSWENLAKVHVTEEENVVLFTGYKQDAVTQLGIDARKCAVLDSACSSTVCGEMWLKDYLNSLDESDRRKVETCEGHRLFKFGGGTKLMSKGEYSIPAEMAGKTVTIKTDVVDSDIPLLLSRSAMKTAGVKLDLENDTATVFGKDLSLNLTSSGHYCIPIDKAESIPVENVFVTLQDSQKQLFKLHRQFAHPPTKRLKALLCDAGAWEDEYEDELNKIVRECDMCKLYARTPSRPVVGLPMAKVFNESVAMDLKQWNGKWILHMIDVWSRYTVSVFVERKRPFDIIDCMMTHWVSVYGVMASILTDNGGEFSSDEMREITSILNVRVCTTAGESPFQNGLCERNHAVTDMMLTKLEAENSNTSRQTLLSWANMAKNALQMWNGFSSHQLVFGQNPNLPGILKDNIPALEGTTSSEKFANHLNALHGARKAFIETEASDRIRRALRSKIRASEQKYSNGDLVFYKREGKDRWLGPGKVVFQDGKVVFVRHGGVFVRVSPNRLVNIESKSGPTDNSIPESRSCEDRCSTTVKCETDTDGQKLQSISELVTNQLVVGTNSDNCQNRVAPIVNTEHSKHLPAGSKIQYEHENQWKTAEIISRAGKATGKYKNWYNVKNDSDGEHSVNLEMVNWKLIDNTNNTSTISNNSEVMCSENKSLGNDTYIAQQTELEKLVQFKTYDEVPDIGQKTLSTRWVMTHKDGQVKARLVVRGFEEHNMTQSDSPTIGKGAMRIFLAVAALKGWDIKTTDIKAAFLQGKEIERDVFVKPPRESSTPLGYVWKLKHGLYGLKDGARQFYLSVKDELTALGFEECKLDPALFCLYSEGELQGLICCHVDDFLHAGGKSFEGKMEKLRDRFTARKTGEKCFKYIGFNMIQTKDEVKVDHTEYVNSIMLEHMKPVSNENSEIYLDEADQTKLRQIVGKLNWIVQGSRPDMAFEMITLSTKLKTGTMSDLIRARKTIRRLKETESFLLYPKLVNDSSLTIVVFTDASLGNINDGTGSTCAHIVWLLDREGNCCPIFWQANKIRRVVRSTIAAEALGLQEGIEAGIYYRHMLAHILGVMEMTIPINIFIDNKSVLEAVSSTKLVGDKRLRIDIAAIQQELQRGEVKNIHWVPGSLQLANVMTKQGAHSGELLSVLQSGKMNEEVMKFVM